jgi:ABC-type nitrate/sulfonate/bicarbonate transport system substrate-binding protein
MIYRRFSRLMTNIGRGAAALAIMMAGTIGASAQTALKVMVFPGLTNYSIFAAQQKGFFTKQGLSIELINTPSSDVQRERLARGEVQIVETAVDNAVAMVERAKVDVVIVTGGDNGYNRIFVQPEIASYAALRGKTVVVDAPDTAYALLLYRALKNAGLDKGDYKVNPVGGSTQRLEAMTKDRANAAAAVLNAPTTFRAAAAGLKDMGSATAAVGAYQAIGTVAMRSWAQANADTLQRYIRAIVEGGRWVLDPANRTEATQLLVDRLQLAPDIAAKSYALAIAALDGMARDAKFDPEGFRNVLQLRAEFEGGGGGAPPPIARYYDPSYYNKALAGF